MRLKSPGFSRGEPLIGIPHLKVGKEVKICESPT